MANALPDSVVTYRKLSDFLKRHARGDELNELARILKCREQGERTKAAFSQDLVKKLYKRYQTPAGYVLKTPTVDQMCDRVAKKLKFRKLEGRGWRKLHNLCVCMFERLFESMTEEEKEKLLREMWAQLSPEDKKQLKRDFDIANVASLIHSSELMVAHVAGVYLARETALYAAAAVVRLSLGAEFALAARTVLTRTATVFLGPVGWALIAVSVNDLVGTNFKRVVPALLAINTITARVHETWGAEFLELLDSSTPTGNGR